MKQLSQDNFEKFVRAYVHCGLWTTPGDGEGAAYLDADHDIESMAPQAMITVRALCQKFVDDNEEDIVAYMREMEHVRHRGEGTAIEWAGHDFLLSSNGHGAGFLDRPSEGLDATRAGRLQFAAQAAKSMDFYVGDDGLVYVIG